jgi:hypothetical protein
VTSEKREAGVANLRGFFHDREGFLVRPDYEVFAVMNTQPEMRDAWDFRDWIVYPGPGRS